MKALSIGGTAAMFLVGGGILIHGIPPLSHRIEALESGARKVEGIGGILAELTSLASDLLVGAVAGAVVLAGVTVGQKVFRKKAR